MGKPVQWSVEAFAIHLHSCLLVCFFSSMECTDENQLRWSTDHIAAHTKWLHGGVFCFVYKNEPSKKNGIQIFV